MIEKYTQTYDRGGVNNALPGVFKLPTIDGTISSIRIDASTVSDGDALFQATIDGVEIVGSGDLFIADTDDFVEVAGLSIATTEGGWLYVNLLSPLPAGLPDPPYGLTIFWDNGVPVVADEIHAATGKTTPVDADELGIVDSAASNVLKKLTWANLKATAKTYFDSLYQPVDSDLTTIAGLTATTDSFLQAKSSAWASRTIAQVKTDLSLTGTNSGDETASTLGVTINAASAATPNNTDLVATVDTSVVKKITWTNVKAFLKTYFDTLYQATGAVDDTAYDATSWDGVTTIAPSKNAVRDKIEALVAGAASISDTAFGGGWNGDTTNGASKNALYDYLITLASLAGTETLTNKRVTPRIGTTASSSTPTPDADAHDEYTVTALAAGATFGAPTGTPTEGQCLVIRIKDNGSAQTLAFNAIYRAIGVTLPTTTVISKTVYLGMIYNSASSTWDVLGVQQEA